MASGAAARAARALAERKEPGSADLFLDALRVHADYVDGVRTANLDVLARAVAAAGIREAALPLAAHLGRPETPPADVVEIARALGALGGTDALPALGDYLATYRADAGADADPAALAAVAAALGKLGGAAERQLLRYAADDARTLEALRGPLRRALAAVPGEAERP